MKYVTEAEKIKAMQKTACDHCGTPLKDHENKDHNFFTRVEAEGKQYDTIIVKNSRIKEIRKTNI